MKREKNIHQFSLDAKTNEGYIYTTKGSLSSQMANKRLTDVTIELIKSFKNKTIIDIGCGDGTYTLELLAKKPKYILGIDPAEEAIKKAKKDKKKLKNIDFRIENIYHLDRLNKTFDIAVVRGVLHHLYDAPRAAKILSKIAKVIIIIEPNGYNPMLKIIEKISPYHKAHEEKSYSPPDLDRWFEDNSCQINKRMYAGLVPFFCPDWLAKILKKIEPTVEKIPLLNRLLCAVYIQRIATSL